MKTLLAFMSGSLVTTLAVVLAGGYHAGMVILGGFLTVLALIALVCGFGIPRVSRWLLALHSANETVYLEHGVRSANVGKPVLVIDQPEECQQKNKNRVQSQEVLSTVEQDVLSALVNLGTPFKQAERAILACAERGDSFEDLFKRALTGLRRIA